MEIISVTLGINKEIQIRDKVDRTGIYKLPVHNAVQATKPGLEGDFNGKKKHQGGPNQAVYI
jgi:MOSC domain-containing protein YiiM